jgi:hypothetical protein
MRAILLQLRRYLPQVSGVDTGEARPSAPNLSSSLSDLPAEDRTKSE